MACKAINEMRKGEGRVYQKEITGVYFGHVKYEMPRRHSRGAARKALSSRSSDESFRLDKWLSPGDDSAPQETLRNV